MQEEQYMIAQRTIMEYRHETYKAASNRFDGMIYKRCGNSGVLMPLITVGMAQNYGSTNTYEQSRSILLTAFDLGLNHFDTSNQYGYYFGDSEEMLGKIYRKNLKPYRDELLISTKAGWEMWPGPYGEHGSRKHLMAAVDQSLKRLGMDYVDIYYHHRPDPRTPLEETMTALSDIVKQGKALYIGLSRYPAETMKKAAAILRKLGTPCLVETYGYSMYERWSEKELHGVLEEEGIGSACFFPMAAGMLTNRYLNGIPEGSRLDLSKKNMVGRNNLDQKFVTEERLNMSRQLNKIAEERGQSLAQMALAWILRKPVVATCVVGASRPEQVRDNAAIVKNLDFSQEELDRIEAILSQGKEELVW